MNTTLKTEIEKLKAKKNAVILAHYYAPEEVQDVADYIGDSFYLAKIAKKSTADILVLCGVYFMGESAKLLNPTKKVLMPDITADCPMAHMVTAEKIHQMRRQYQDLAVVCYINSTAELKALSDVCVTSSNAVSIVKALPNQNIFFIPDKNLGSFVAKSVPEKNILLNDGCCPIHAAIAPTDVMAQKQAHPQAQVLTHPECEPEILAISDFIGSTSEIIRYATESDCTEFIICTEDGVHYKLTRDNPTKQFYFPSPRPCCAGMKRNTLETLLRALQTEENEITAEPEMATAALNALDQMLTLAR